MRKSVVADQFYPADKTVLINKIKSLTKNNPDNKIKAMIVPHAGYDFSGKCAGKGFSVLPSADTYILFGVNHQAIGEDIAISLEHFETPLGIVKNNQEFGKQLLKELKIQEDSEAHKYEHSIEVQLPFLQVSQENFKIVPIILKNINLKKIKQLAKTIFNLSEKLKLKIIPITSSDFTHSGPNYGNNIDIKIDKQAINSILKLETENFLKISEKTTICGNLAIACCIEIAKLMKSKEARLLDYYDSSQIIPSQNKVGYASIAFY